MSENRPQSSKNIYPLIREITNLGWVDIPTQFNGSGAPGNTLEYLLDIKVNNYDSPDLHDWEIKFHGGNSLLTLFHKDPQPKGIMNKLVDVFGWETKNGRGTSIRNHGTKFRIHINNIGLIYKHTEII